MQALIFDVDGTLADTETVHLQAFNAAFAEVGLDWFWDEALYTRLLKVAGGKERLLHYWHVADLDEADGASVNDAVHAIKTRHYAARVRDGGLPFRPGIARLIAEAEAAAIPVAIATTTTPADLDALLQTPFGPAWRTRFAAICDAGTNHMKKPSPDVYLDVLRQLGLKSADCIAFEDSANGLRAARAAGVPTVVTTTAYTSQDNFDGALAVLPHLGEPHALIPSSVPDEQPGWVDLATLRHWHLHALTEVA
ncbi:Protein CbbY [Paraburkholderia aspalathi]|uniref:Protein CbbY n=1 Tax=Paraburkholderia aspalathi TaxID=1324617 RepID=A0ABN7N9F4_9BURK|nr:HAD-IA family hydrolase [Paraburkholderia aspalathi]MBK3824075.1 HAD-IA family hydrolase [Paraburkholderia aspalathi]MBK3835916.1 HAD-IA family hydrolase [Paraburkholderia aspalathi]MBK3865693.1 HAD-IA family hydrolase [Paraburkholderia aspalathi]CAE6864662.1 Protein CbbY [Paraburkholderia aspalathi]